MSVVTYHLTVTLSSPLLSQSAQWVKKKSVLNIKHHIFLNETFWTCVTHLVSMIQ